MIEKGLSPFLRVSKKPSIVKTEFCMIGGSFYCSRWFPVYLQKNKKTQKSLLRKGFDLLRNSPSTVPPVRRRVRVACLDGSFDLCQSVKKEFFDRLGGMAVIRPPYHFIDYLTVGSYSSGSPIISIVKKSWTSKPSWQILT